MKNEQLSNIDSIKNQQHAEYITVDKNGSYWRSAGGAVLCCNDKSNFIKKINLPSTDKQVPPFPLYLDSNSVLWMGYQKKFLEYNTITGLFRVYCRLSYHPG